MEKQVLHGTSPGVFTTNPRDPEEGRTFVWARGRWYEREVGDWGNVTFPPVADSEDELRKLDRGERSLCGADQAGRRVRGHRAR